MFIYGYKVTTWLNLLLTLHCLATATAEDAATPDEVDPLIAVESTDQKTIIKQINKLNQDGTYTFGYEADDGTFKYESRDVLGNIKGTFGFVDTDGVIKRISYTSNNDSDTSTSIEVSEELVSTPKYNKSTSTSSSTPVTTRRPVSLIFPHISTPPPRSNVIQAIPRRKSSTTTSSPTSIPSATESSRPFYGHYLRQTSETTTPSISTSPPPRVVYATSVPSTSPRIIMPSSPHTRPVLQNGIFIRSTIPPQSHGRIEGQLIRPVQIDSTTSRPVTDGTYIRRILVSRQPLSDQTTITETHPTSTSKTELEDLTDKDSDREKKPFRANTFRRQLNQEKDHGFDAQQQVLNFQQSAGGDTTDIYGSSIATGTQRPLFTTTQGPRVIPAPIPRHLSGRPGQYVPIGFHRNLIRSRSNQQDPLAEAPTTQPPVTEDPYQTQTTIPVISIPDYRDQDQNHQRQLQLQRPLPHNIIRNREYVNVDPRLGYIHSNHNYDNDPYIQNPNQANGPVQFPQVSPPPTYGNRVRRPRPIPVPTPNDHRQVSPYPPDYPDQQQPYPVPIAIPIPQLPHQQQPQRYRAYPNPNEITGNALHDDISPPVTTQDFQRLLNQLIYVQTKLQQLTNLHGLNIYPQPPQQVYDPRYQQPVYQQPVPQPSRAHPQYGPIQFENNPVDPRSRAYVPPFANQQYEQQQQQQQQQQFYDPRYVPQRRLFHPQNPYENVPPEYLPPQIREMLLLRMLQLAINSEIAATNQMEVVATPPPKTRKTAPIRNVKILGEERERLKPTVRSKRYPEPDPDEDMQYYE